MIGSTGAEPNIDRYLAQVRVALRGLPEREIDDILRELRSHVNELAGQEGSGPEAALQSLGDPLDLAHTYRAENQMVRAQCSGSPLIILQGMRHASRGTLGRVTANTLYVLGYFGMGTLWAAALEKLLAPSRGGLWYTPGDFWSTTLVVGGNPPLGTHEPAWLVGRSDHIARGLGSQVPQRPYCAMLLRAVRHTRRRTLPTRRGPDHRHSSVPRHTSGSPCTGSESKEPSRAAAARSARSPANSRRATQTPARRSPSAWTAGKRTSATASPA